MPGQADGRVGWSLPVIPQGWVREGLPRETPGAGGRGQGRWEGPGRRMGWRGYRAIQGAA